MEERRRSPRFKVATEIMGRVRSTMQVHVLDMSEHGMLVESPIGLPPNGVCEITVSTPSGEHVLSAKVKRCRAQVVKSDGRCEILYHAGLEFDADRVNAKELEKLIAEICEIDSSSANGSKAESADGTSGFKFAM